jgi:hypothetical protein
MNEKLAKKLRLLTRQFAEKGVIDGKEWARYGHFQIPGVNAGTAGPIQGPTVLDPKCPKGVYRELKRRANGRRKLPMPWDGPVTPATQEEVTEKVVTSAPL